ncbi:Uncharacterised protein [Mycobacteroides abscessus subsp. abscessus]|nr:Uncharacterised protein [Mycobacteroides abscessus subsp. abscessus]
MAQLVDRQVPDVDAVDAHRAPGDVLESRHEGGERRLARPGGAHQRERLSRRDAQVESAQGEPVGVGEVEVDVVEVELPAEAPDVRVVGDPAVGIGDVVADVDDLPVATGGRDRHEGVGEEEPEHLDGHPQHHRDRHSGHDRADRRPSLHDAPRAHPDDRGLGERGKEDEEGPEPRVELRLAHLEALEPAREHGEALGGPRGAAEGLEDPDALDRLLDVGRDLTDRVLRSA